MPYIKSEKRPGLDIAINNLIDSIIDASDPNSETDFAGVLNYCISRTIAGIVIRNGKLRYWRGALIRGVLMDVADEFYRRIIAPYEDKQIKNNGDVDYFEYLSIKNETEK